MGGNLIQQYGFPEKRLEAKEYFSLIKRIESGFPNKIYSLCDFAPIKTYKNKNSFGDLDYLLSTHPSINWHEEIRLMFPSSSFYHSNGDVLSIEIDGFQVDFIFIQPELFDVAYHYFSYNDLGNLLGRIAHKFGLSYGHNGLKYSVRFNQTHELGEIVLSTVTRQIVDFLGYDYSIYEKGFDNLEDIYKFVVSGEYFNAEIFDLENANHRAKARNRKRPTYTGFLQYLKDNNIQSKYVFDSNKDNYLDFIDLSFPSSDFLYKRANMLKEAQWAKDQRDRVMNVAKALGFEGMELGFIIKRLNQRFEDKKGYLKYIEGLTDREIEEEMVRERIALTL